MGDARPLIVDEKRILAMIEKKVAEHRYVAAGCKALGITRNQLYKMRTGERSVGKAAALAVKYKKIKAFRRIDT